MKSALIITLLLTAAMPAAAVAQDLGAPIGGEQPVEKIATEAGQDEADEGISFTVTDESAWSDIGIAIPAFATDRDRPTPANEAGTGALGRGRPRHHGQPAQ